MLMSHTRNSLWMLLAGFVFTLFLSSAFAQDQEEVLWDTWMLMKMAGDESGWVHSIITKQKNEDGDIIFKTELVTHMEMMRFGQSVKISAEAMTLEDESGNVFQAHQKTIMSGNEMLYDLELRGEEAIITVTTMGTPRESKISWEEDVRGPMGIWLLRKEKGREPGTKFSYKSFSFDFSRVFTSSVEVKGPDETELLGGEKATFCRSVSTVDVMPGVKTNEWLDDNYDTIKTSVSIMGMEIETFRTTKERAQKAGGAELKTDMILETMAKANISLPSPYKLDSILYHFKAKNPDLGIPEGLADFRQEVKESDGQTATVLIRTVVPESSQNRPLKDPQPDLVEYLEPNAFLQSDDPGLKAKAQEVVGGETDAWKAACLLEHFVWEYISDKNFGTGFATAAEVFENPRGDCSEHGVLLAAMCRAAGIPARVAMGYMYLGGIFGGHMWAEVWINGEWYPIDGVMGIGRVDPTHITFCTSSLKDSGVGDAFVSAVQGLGNLEITILEFTRGDRTIKVGEHFKDYVIDGDTYTNTLHGISITKPEEYTFDNYEREFSGPDFDLVKFEGETVVDIKALPAAFSFTMKDFKDLVKSTDGEILSELPRKVCGHDSSVFMIKQGDAERRVLALITNDTCYVISMEIKNEEKDIADFEAMVKSIRFSE